MESFRVRGEWWLPDQEDEKINGVLEFEPRKGGTLELDGSLNSESEGFIKPELIHGKTTNNKKMTLQGCHQVRSSGIELEDAMETSSFKIERIFKQGHLKEVEFDTVRVEFPYLDTWMNKRTFREIGLEQENTTKIERKNFSYSVDYEDLEISFKATTSGGHNVGKEYAVRRKCFIDIEGEERVDYQRLNDLISYLQDFLNLTSGEDVSPRRITGYLSGEKFPNNEINIPQDIEVFQIVNQDFKGEESKAVQLMLMPFETFEDDLSNVLTTWLDMRQKDKMKWALNLYFGIRYNDSMYINQRLVNLIQGLEVYYDFNNEGKYMPKGKFDEKVRKDLYDQIPKDIDDKVQDTPEEVKSLEQRLRQEIRKCYKYSLRDKLIQCYRAHEDTYNRLEIDIEFIKKAKDTRHHYTHFSLNEDKIFSFQEMPEAIVKLRSIMDLNILLELGLEEDMVTDRIVNYYLQHYGLGRKSTSDSS